MSQQTPARKCRLSLYSSKYFNSPSLIPEDFDYTAHENNLYILTQEIKDEEEKKPESERDKIVFFMYSIGLVCFGNINSVEDVINSFSFVNQRMKTMVFVLRELLPLPSDISINTPNLLKQWVSDNKNRLEWSEKEGRYLLLER
jgi:hypothetical protein